MILNLASLIKRVSRITISSSSKYQTPTKFIKHTHHPNRTTTIPQYSNEIRAYHASNRRRGTLQRVHLRRPAERGLICIYKLSSAQKHRLAALHFHAKPRFHPPVHVWPLYIIISCVCVAKCYLRSQIFCGSIGRSEFQSDLGFDDGIDLLFQNWKCLFYLCRKWYNIIEVYVGGEMTCCLGFRRELIVKKRWRFCTACLPNGAFRRCQKIWRCGHCFVFYVKDFDFGTEESVSFHCLMAFYSNVFLCRSFVLQNGFELHISEFCNWWIHEVRNIS